MWYDEFVRFIERAGLTNAALDSQVRRFNAERIRTGLSTVTAAAVLRQRSIETAVTTKWHREHPLAFQFA